MEDDEDDYTLTRDLLFDIPDLAFELQWVKDFGGALSAVSEASHDVCLLDYRLGEGTGLELLEKIRQKGCRIPVIFLTGRGDRAMDLLALESGADDYLEKGRTDSSLLERSIRHAIARRHKEDARKKVQETLERNGRRFRSVMDNTMAI